MSELRKKFIAIFIPIVGILIWSLIIMINSFSTNETWRIVLSTIGFLGFFTLTSFFVRSMIRKMEIKKEQ
jgi:predicted PurR-regulated permease PerM